MKLKSLRVLLSVLCEILLLSTFFSAQMIMANGNDETAAKVQPAASFAGIGDTFKVKITIVDVQSLYGIQITLHWNSSILQIVHANVRLGVENNPDGVLHNSSAARISIYSDQILNEQGQYVLAASSISPAPSFNGSGNIAEVTFNVTNSGTCELDLEAELVSNIIPPGSIHVAPITHTTENGFFGPIEVIASSETATAGENVSINGFVAPAQANVSVEIMLRNDEETEWHTIGTAKTDEQGSYLYAWKPEKSGKYYVKSVATVLGNEQTSSPISIEVNNPEQPAWLFIGILISALAVLVAIFIVYAVRTRRKQRTNLK